MNDDKRGFPRFLFSEPVAYGLTDVTVNGSIAGNISLNGLSLKVQEFIPVGTVLELQINLGHSPKVLWAQAQVVRMREILSEDCFEIGLKFIQDEKCLKAIGAYIDTCRSNQ